MPQSESKRPRARVTANARLLLRLTVPLALAATSASAHGQSSDPAGAAAAGATRTALAPLPVVESASAAQFPLVNSGQELTGGEVRWVPIPTPSDEAPLPIGPRIQEGADGDTLVAPGGGDPFVLGFAAGSYAPPAGERIDPALVARFAALGDDGRPQAETYAFVMFERKITADRVAALEAVGARVLGHHPLNCVRVALQEGSLAGLSALDFVRWVGLAQPWQKVHPELTARLADESLESIQVIVSVFESDLNEASIQTPFGSVQLTSPEGPESLPADWHDPHGRWRTNGWQERALAALGLEIELFSPRSNSFRARMTPQQLEALIALDFVQFVEAQGTPTGAHDESMPLIHADLTRASWNGGASAVAVVGEADSGIDTGHSGLNHIWGWGWDLASSGGAWTDLDEHGSHVAGTIFGRADVDRSKDGVAPGLGSTRSLRVFNVKIFNDLGNWGGASMTDILDRFSQQVDDGAGNITPRPHVINHSWGTLGSTWYGTESDCRELDNDVWTYGQMHVFAAGNEGSAGSSLRMQAASKNVFSVGNVLDYHDAVGYPGTIWTSSSRGPTADNRWKPNVVAPGRLIESVDANSSTGYVNKSGTSMAAPHVTGLAAQLVDHYSFLRYRPSVLGAVMMASALTKGGVLLATPSTSSTSHFNTYGAGRIEAARAHNLTSQALYFWQFDMTSSSAHAELDFAIGAGASKVSCVMFYNERAGSAGGSVALVNDLDMYIDRAPFAAGGNTGDYSAHQSSRDNTEIRILSNPAEDSWRIKVYPENIPATLLNTVRVGVAVVVTYGDDTPAATLTTALDDAYVKPNDVVQLTATVACPTSVASAVHLDSAMTGTLLSAETTLLDGRVADLMDNPNSGDQVTLGNIRGGHSRNVRWTARWASEGAKLWQVSMDSDNAGAPISTKTVYVDGTAPGMPGAMSTNHPVNSVTCNTALQVNWSSAIDNLAGIDGYQIAVNHDPTPLLFATANLGAVTSYSTTLTPSTSAYYIHLRAVDRSGNWGPFRRYGPFTISAGAATNYCIGALNSVGLGATIGRLGSFSIGSNNFQLRTTGLPNTGFALTIMSQQQGQSVLGDGFLCLSGTITRLGIAPIAGNTSALALNFNAAPVSSLVDPGETWNFQTWYRDALPGGAGYNLSNALRVTFCD
ncbi:MAG: S8 family serine peptidase [Planctomycetota bacterium]